jgi:hypothetical protein
MSSLSTTRAKLPPGPPERPSGECVLAAIRLAAVRPEGWGKPSTARRTFVSLAMSSGIDRTLGRRAGIEVARSDVLPSTSPYLLWRSATSASVNSRDNEVER